MSATHEEIKKALQDMLGTETGAKKVVEALADKQDKPAGWGRRSSASYYNEVYAEQSKKVLDEMMIDRKDRLFSYGAWPHLSAQSVYLRVNQSLRFLVDHADKDGVYRKFLSMISITRERNLGVKLTFIEEFRNGPGSTFAPTIVVPSSDVAKWKQRMETWLEDSEPGEAPFVVNNLLLSPDEIKDLKLEFAGLKSVLASISATSVKLIKINP